MLTIGTWKSMIWDIKDLKEYKGWYSGNYVNEESLKLYLQLLILIPFTPIIVIADILILPFEIIYYFFKKWIKR